MWLLVLCPFPSHPPEPHRAQTKSTLRPKRVCRGQRVQVKVKRACCSIRFRSPAPTCFCGCVTLRMVWLKRAERLPKPRMNGAPKIHEPRHVLGFGSTHWWPHVLGCSGHSFSTTTSEMNSDSLAFKSLVKRLMCCSGMVLCFRTAARTQSKQKTWSQDDEGNLNMVVPPCTSSGTNSTTEML